MTKNISKAFWFQALPAWVLGFITICLLIIGVIEPVYLILTFIMWVLACGLGIAVGYHRVFSHKTHKLPAWKENIIMFFAVFAGQGASIFWTALHRGYHHPYSDQPKDIHSPVIYGKWHAFAGWILTITESKNPVNIKYAVDLLRKPNHVWFHNHHLKILWGVPIIVGLIFGWKVALVAFWLPACIGSCQDNLVNVYGHTKGLFGYRNYNLPDNSHNNLILGYLAWGQGWHNNHHYAPMSFDFGKAVSGKWWEIDMCNIFKPFLGSSNESKGN